MCLCCKNVGNLSNLLCQDFEAGDHVVDIQQATEDLIKLARNIPNCPLFILLNVQRGLLCNTQKMIK